MASTVFWALQRGNQDEQDLIPASRTVADTVAYSTCTLFLFSVEMRSLFKATWGSTSDPVPPPIHTNSASCLQMRSSSLGLWLSSCNYETTSMKIESQDTEDSGGRTWTMLSCRPYLDCWPSDFLFYEINKSLFCLNLWKSYILLLAPERLRNWYRGLTLVVGE